MKHNLDASGIVVLRFGMSRRMEKVQHKSFRDTRSTDKHLGGGSQRFIFALYVGGMSKPWL